jgi:hypothetical protein
VKAKAQEKNIILNDVPNTTESKIYYLKNNSSKSVWIDHPVKNASANAGWSSYLRPGKWSVLVLDKKDFAMSCAVIQPGKVDYLNCAQALSVCMPPQILVKSARKGSYWLLEDKTWEELQKIMEKKKSAVS